MFEGESAPHDGHRQLTVPSYIREHSEHSITLLEGICDYSKVSEVYNTSDFPKV